MKYWLMTTEFPPLHGGGISTYCLHTAKMLSENGHEVKVFINDISVNDFSEEKVSGLYTLIRFNPERNNFKKILGYDARLSMEFSIIVEEFIQKEGKPDYIETQDYLGIGYYLQQKSWMNSKILKDIPIVVCMHAPSFLYLPYNQTPLYKLPTYWTSEMEKASIRMADLLLSPSQYLIDKLSDKVDFSLQNAVKLYNPFEHNQEVSSNYTEGELAFFGKLTPQKGCLEMLEYLQQMWDNGFDKALKIIGGGAHFFHPQQMDMQDFIQKKYESYIKKGLIVFEGNLAPSNLKKRLASVHVVVVPSIVDNLPYAVIEAMAMGKLVLASNCGGHTELIDSGKNAYLFSHEPHDFEEKLKEILALESERIKKIGRNAQKTIQDRLNYKSVYEQKKALLDSIPPRKNVFPFTGKILNTEKIHQLKENKKLSVVIPFYNLGATLEESVTSVLNSTYSNLELIVVNDGSNEQALQKAEELKNKYDFKLLHKPNSGLSETRNFGAKSASGEFLAFLDADDLVEPEYYQKAIALLNTYSNIHFVGCWANYFGESNEVWPAFNPEPPYLLYHNMINSSALVYKKQSFLEHGLNKKKMIYGMEDYESLINMVKNGARGVALPEVLWHYRIRKDSMQQSFNTNKKQYLYTLIADEHKEFFNMHGAELSKLFNHNGPGYLMENPSMGRSYNKYLELIPKSVIKVVKGNLILRNMGKVIYKTFNKS